MCHRANRRVDQDPAIPTAGGSTAATTTRSAAAPQRHSAAATTCSGHDDPSGHLDVDGDEMTLTMRLSEMAPAAGRRAATPVRRRRAAPLVRRREAATSCVTRQDGTSASGGELHLRQGGGGPVKTTARRLQLAGGEATPRRATPAVTRCKQRGCASLELRTSMGDLQMPLFTILPYDCTCTRVHALVYTRMGDYLEIRRTCVYAYTGAQPPLPLASRQGGSPRRWRSRRRPQRPRRCGETGGLRRPQRHRRLPRSCRRPQRHDEPVGGSGRTCGSCGDPGGVTTSVASTAARTPAAISTRTAPTAAAYPDGHIDTNDPEDSARPQWPPRFGRPPTAAAYLGGRLATATLSTAPTTLTAPTTTRTAPTTTRRPRRTLAR
ncbi:unnamed protein product [Urochloa humidicola]